jgi:hypothetical protein
MSWGNEGKHWDIWPLELQNRPESKGLTSTGSCFPGKPENLLPWYQLALSGLDQKPLQELQVPFNE